MLGRVGAIAFTIGATLAALSCSAPPSAAPALSVPDAQATAVRRTAVCGADHIAGGQVHFVSSGVFSGTPADHHSEARLQDNLLQIDLDGDGQITSADMEITLIGLNGTLTDANFVTTGVNHAPTNIALVGSSVAENSAVNTVLNGAGVQC